LLNKWLPDFLHMSFPRKGLLKKLGYHEKERASKISFLSLLLPLTGRRSRRIRELRVTPSPFPTSRDTPPQTGKLLPTKREKV